MTNDEEKKKATVMVAGASGAIGAKVVELLIADGTHHIIAGSRTPEKLSHFAEAGVELRKVDFDDPGAMPAAFAGAERLLIISTDVLYQPGARLRQHKDAIDAAAKAGVQHIIYTSMPNPEPPQLIFYSADHWGTELHLKASGVPHTILRNGWYFEIVYPFVINGLQTGRWPTITGDQPIAYVARDDCAEAAYAVLATGTGLNKTFALSGGEALTVTEMAAMATEVFGSPIKVEQVTIKERADYLLSTGISAVHLPIVMLSEVNQALGWAATVHNGIEELLNRKPRSFRDGLLASKSADGALHLDSVTENYAPRDQL